MPSPASSATNSDCDCTGVLASSSMMRACRAALVAGTSARRDCGRADRALVAITTLHQERQQRLLGMQPVLGLVEDERMRAVDDRRGDLFATVGRQAVQHHDVVVGDRDQPVIELVAGECHDCAAPIRSPGPSTPRRRCRARRRRSLAATGSVVTVTLPPLAYASAARPSTISGGGSKPAGDATRTCMPARRRRAGSSARRCCRHRRR